VEPERIGFVSHAPLAEYMAMHHRIDIALDPLPYTGHSTSLDAYWMGAPVVTLAGATAASRGGVSIANNLGMTELIAYTNDQYIEIAAGLAGDLARLNELRLDLRRRMQSSPLMDAQSFTRHLEHAYREMWRNRLGRLGSEKNRSA
jgi:protein O-GlcNAc transferase